MYEAHLDPDLERRCAEEIDWDDDWPAEDLELAGEEDQYDD